MKRTRMKYHFRLIKIGYVLIVIQIFFIFTAGYGQTGLNRFSFEFNQCSVSEALHQISQGAGVKISAPFDELQNKKVKKAYKNIKIENIIADMLREQNYAIVWKYQNDRLVHVEIRLEENDASRRSLMEITLNASSSDKIQSTESLFVPKHQIEGAKPVTQHSSMEKLSNEKRNDTSGPPPPDPERFKGLELPPMPSSGPPQHK